MHRVFIFLSPMKIIYLAMIIIIVDCVCVVEFFFKLNDNDKERERTHCILFVCYFERRFQHLVKLDPVLFCFWSKLNLKLTTSGQHTLVHLVDG